VGGNVCKDAEKGADAERVMLGNRQVVFPMLKRGEAKMAAGLSGDSVSKTL
jgi:hypothetical protein